MHIRLKQTALLWVIYSAIGVGLTACGVAVRPIEPGNAVQNNQVSGLQISDAVTASKSIEVVSSDSPGSANQCSAVDEKSLRSTCFNPSSGGRMCQPQSIPYARCRSHISNCSLGNTSPVQLFNCEQQLGYTSNIPKEGALMSIGVNHVHHMSTGHTLYVEEVCPNQDGTFKLRVSHTNYDRKCHLEEDAWVLYDPQQRYADFKSGHWAAWGKHLPVQGFIMRERISVDSTNSNKN